MHTGKRYNDKAEIHYDMTQLFIPTVSHFRLIISFKIPFFSSTFSKNSLDHNFPYTGMIPENTMNLIPYWLRCTHISSIILESSLSNNLLSTSLKFSQSVNPSPKPKMNLLRTFFFSNIRILVTYCFTPYLSVSSLFSALPQGCFSQLTINFLKCLQCLFHGGVFLLDHRLLAEVRL